MKALRTQLFDEIRKDPLGKEALKSFVSGNEEKHTFTVSSGKKYIIVSTESKEFADYQKKKMAKTA
ncbi:TPA: hypothetical protein RFY31_003403 [Klebsiella aerogenes]|nr:hypothetical protein [Salmonella enterica subsp. enterica serovar Stanley]HDU6303691.1 hypothetical protein [Klebsiella aerogenes]